MGIEKRVVSVRMDEALLQRLKEIAQQQNRPFSNLVETVMKDYAAKWEEQQ